MRSEFQYPKVCTSLPEFDIHMSGFDGEEFMEITFGGRVIEVNMGHEYVTNLNTVNSPYCCALDWFWKETHRLGSDVFVDRLSLYEVYEDKESYGVNPMGVSTVLYQTRIFPHSGVIPVHGHLRIVSPVIVGVDSYSKKPIFHTSRVFPDPSLPCIALVSSCSRPEMEGIDLTGYL